jgi:hypothetical protein
VVSKIGDWKKVAALIKQMQAKFNVAEKQVLQKIGIKSEELAVSRIDEQPSEWETLSEDYVAQKIKKGLSENTYIATGSYRLSITSFVVGRVAYAGLKKVARNKEGKELADIAKTLEYGSVKRNIPPRPLWQPTKQKVIKWLKDTNFVEEEFKRALL